MSVIGSVVRMVIRVLHDTMGVGGGWDVVQLLPLSRATSYTYANTTIIGECSSGAEHAVVVRDTGVRFPALSPQTSHKPHGVGAASVSSKHVGRVRFPVWLSSPFGAVSEGVNFRVQAVEGPEHTRHQYPATRVIKQWQAMTTVSAVTFVFGALLSAMSLSKLGCTSNTDASTPVLGSVA